MVVKIVGLSVVVGAVELVELIVEVEVTSVVIKDVSFFRLVVVWSNNVAFVVELKLIDGVDEIIVLLLSSLAIVSFAVVNSSFTDLVVVVVAAVLAVLVVDISVDVVVSAVELRLVVDDNSLKVTFWIGLVDFITLNVDNSTVSFEFDFAVVNNVVEFKIRVVFVVSIVVFWVVVDSVEVDVAVVTFRHVNGLAMSLITLAAALEAESIGRSVELGEVTSGVVIVVVFTVVDMVVSTIMVFWVVVELEVVFWHGNTVVVVDVDDDEGGFVELNVDVSLLTTDVSLVRIMDVVVMVFSEVVDDDAIKCLVEFWEHFVVE